MGKLKRKVRKATNKVNRYSSNAKKKVKRTVRSIKKAVKRETSIAKRAVVARARVGKRTVGKAMKNAIKHDKYYKWLLFNARKYGVADKLRGILQKGRNRGFYMRRISRQFKRDQKEIWRA